MPPHLANFVFLVETGFHHVGRADHKLLASGDSPALASQSAGITDVSHGAQPIFFPFWWRMGSCYVAKAALEFLAQAILPLLPSQALGLHA